MTLEARHKLKSIKTPFADIICLTFSLKSSVDYSIARRFGPLSDLISSGDPLLATNRLKLFKNESVSKLWANFYVDDCLKSIKGETKAISLVSELRALLSIGGFRLTKWISNSSRGIVSVPASERAVSVKDHLLDQLPCERALGTRWMSFQPSVYCRTCAEVA